MTTFFWVAGLVAAGLLSCAALALAWMKVEMEGHMAREIMSLNAQVRAIEADIEELTEATAKWDAQPRHTIDIFGGHP